VGINISEEPASFIFRIEEVIQARKAKCNIGKGR
jgi:hypothetical protein